MCLHTAAASQADVHRSPPQEDDAAAPRGDDRSMTSTPAAEQKGGTRLALLLAAAMFVLVVETSLMNVSISGDPGVSVGQIVQPGGLVAIPWEQRRGGELRWGIAFRASSIAAAAPAVQAA